MCSRFSKKNARFRSNNEKDLERYQSASPLPYLTKDDAPVMTLHGDKDRVVPVEQAELIDAGYRKLGLESELHIIECAGHGGREFSDSKRFKLVKEFFDRHIKR